MGQSRKDQLGISAKLGLGRKEKPVTSAAGGYPAGSLPLWAELDRLGGEIEPCPSGARLKFESTEGSEGRIVGIEQYCKETKTPMIDPWTLAMLFCSQCLLRVKLPAFSPGVVRIHSPAAGMDFLYVGYGVHSPALGGDLPVLHKSDIAKLWKVYGNRHENCRAVSREDLRDFLSGLIPPKAEDTPAPRKTDLQRFLQEREAAHAAVS